MTSIENFAGSCGVLYTQFMNGQIDLNEFQIAFNTEYQQARQIHKQEIIKAQSYAISNADMTNNKGYFDCEKYYQETFKKD
jgi:hypothetical protein